MTEWATQGYTLIFEIDLYFNVNCDKMVNMITAT